MWGHVAGGCLAVLRPAGGIKWRLVPVWGRSGGWRCHPTWRLTWRCPPGTLTRPGRVSITCPTWRWGGMASRSSSTPRCRCVCTRHQLLRSLQRLHHLLSRRRQQDESRLGGRRSSLWSDIHPIPTIYYYPTVVLREPVHLRLVGLLNGRKKRCSPDMTLCSPDCPNQISSGLLCARFEHQS